jgi:protein-S-isoprenylcysteine O-methyltransferase Ste14
MKKKSWRIPLGFLAAAWFIWKAHPTPASIIAGGIVMLFGELIRFISAGTLKKYREVARTGIYAYTRNPLYIGSFFLGAGACVMGRDILFSILYVVAFITVYSRVIAREEKFLISRYGAEYEQYLAEVPRIIPRTIQLAPLFHQTSAAHAFNNKEGKTLLGVAGIIAVMIVKVFYPF